MLLTGASFVGGGLAGGLGTTVAVFCHELPHELGNCSFNIMSILIFIIFIPHFTCFPRFPNVLLQNENFERSLQKNPFTSRSIFRIHISDKSCVSYCTYDWF